MLLSTQTSHIFHVMGEKDGIDTFARAGYDALDFSMFPMTDFNNVLNTCDINEYSKNLRKLAEDAGLCFNQAHAPFPSWRGNDPEYSANIAKSIERSVKIAGLLGAKTIIVHPIACAGGGEAQKQFNLDFYRKLEPTALEYGIKIALENMWGYDSKRGYIMPNVCSFGADLVEYVDELNPEAFTVCLDLGHCGLIGEEAEHAIKVLGNKHLTALHVHDNNYKSDTHTIPYASGCGMNWTNITTALGEIDYQGDFTYEADNFLSRFDIAALPAAVHFMAELGRTLIQKIDSARPTK